MVTDELQTLAGRAAQGDPEAFGEIYSLTARRVFGLCRHMLGSREAAEDAMSEVFLKVHRAFQGVAGTYNPEQRFLPWLLSVASNFCVDQLRRRGLETRIFAAPKVGFGEEDMPAPEPTGSWTSQTEPTALERLLTDADRETVREALGALPEQYRVPLILRYDGDLSYDQIAGELGLKRNHVATLIFRAKQELRTSLGKARRKGLGKDRP